MSASYLSDDADGAQLGLPVLDAFSGYVAFSAMLAALLQRQQTGTGQRIDASMLDAALLLMGLSVTAHSLGEPAGFGGRPTMVRFRARDRRLFVAALHRKWFESLCRIIGAEELLDDPRFARQRSQAANADALVEAIEARLAARPAADWEREFIAAGMPTSIVRTLGEFLAHPHVEQRGTVHAIDNARIVGTGFRFENDQSCFRGPVPTLGQHTDEILAELSQ